VYGLAAILAAISLLMFIYKWQFLGLPVTSQQQTPTWTVEATIKFQGGPGSIKVNLQIPGLTPSYQVLRENTLSKGYGSRVNYTSSGRTAEWTIRRADGMQSLYYRVVVFEDKGHDKSDTIPPFPPAPVFDEPIKTAVEVLVRDVREQSADAASFTAELLRRMNDPSPDSNIDLLLSRPGSGDDFLQTVTNILAAARIPARIMHGIYLQNQQRQAIPQAWLEIHDGDKWRYFNPANSAEGMPDQFLVWWRGTEPVVTVDGGSNVEIDFAVQRNYLDTMAVAEERAAQRQSKLVEFSLFSLPIQTQAVYSVLLMIPIGAFVIVLMRNIIGLETFGTFMPVLIALAFRETALLWGIILFSLLVALGLSIRFLLERLRLLLVPRLSAVLIVVVILMLLISIFSHKLGLETGLSVALFPMVIISMTIERMSVMWEEQGAGDAIKAGIGSLVVATIAYLAMEMRWLEHLIFTFPELLLLVLAIVILLGRYTGYRLTEIRRFKVLAK
jgi:hypothetical protein